MPIQLAAYYKHHKVKVIFTLEAYTLKKNVK